MSQVPLERRRLAQENNLNCVRKDFGPVDMVPVYSHTSHGLVFSSLVPYGKGEEVVKGFLDSRSWPAHIDMYGFCNAYDGIEPIILPREFHDLKPGYQEICEAFRLFHNLYHDRRSDSYIKIDEAGNETVIAVVTGDLVEIRLKELMEFLSEKEMYLCLGFDFAEQSQKGLDELGISERVVTGSEDGLCWILGYRDNPSGPLHNKSSSLLRGIRLFAPPRSRAIDVENRKHLDFIVGLDDAGNEVTRTCDPSRIYQDDGVEAYLTPVVFSPSVLDKYISQPSKYSVDAFQLRCGGLWRLRMDNDRVDGKVIVYLGDLAGLPTDQEQAHWRAHNIVADAKLSATAFKTQVLAEPADPSRAEHVFRASYTRLEQFSKEQLGWHLLMPLHEGDAYRLASIRVPAHDEQRSFDDFVGNLHNVLIESLNSKELAKLVPVEVRREKLLDGKGIGLLQEVLAGRDTKSAEHIRFLRDLNNLRNKSDGHRKGSGYIEARRRLTDEEDLRLVGQLILEKSVKCLEFLVVVVVLLCPGTRQSQ